VSGSGDLAGLRQQAELDVLTSPRDARHEAQRLLAAAREEADALRIAAEQTAAALVQRAEQQAATIEERARQELFWYRRQLRREREVITRCQRAVLDQLTMLSGFAVETARSLYETPESTLVDEESSGLLDDDLLKLAQSDG